MAPLCMCLLSLAEYVLYSPSFCCPFSPDPRVPPDAGLLPDDVSKVPLPAWPRQGMDATWLSSGLLVHLYSCPYWDAISLSLLFGSLYCILLYLGSLESLLYIYVLLWLCHDVTTCNDSTRIACMF